jgi:hypothetical protein
MSASIGSYFSPMIVSFFKAFWFIITSKINCAATFSITTLVTMAFRIMDLIMTKDTQHNDTRHYNVVIMGVAFSDC